MQVTHDKKLLIAIGRSRKAAQWQNREMLWSEFLDKLANTTRTRETVNDYAAMTKAERDNVKDVGQPLPHLSRRGQCGHRIAGRSGHDVHQRLRALQHAQPHAGEDAPAAHRSPIPYRHAGRVRGNLSPHCRRPDAQPLRSHDL